MKYKYSIVIPVYQSENIIATTVGKTLEVINDNNLSAEVVLINDGSSDDSWNVIKRLAENTKNVKSINLLRNYGQHNAIVCGFAHSSGEYLVTMDDDLQNPPGEILKLITKANEDDYDLVFGVFKEKKHSFYRRIGSRAISYLNSRIFNKPSEITITNFRIIRRDLIDRVLCHNTVYPYIPGLLLKYSGKMANVEVQHEARTVGNSNYSMRKIINLVGRVLINYSSYPLRLVSGIGLFVSLISFVIGMVYLINGFLYGSQVAGWTSLIVLISFLGGFIIALLALIGEYLSRMLSQMSGEKMYYVKDVVE